VGCEKCVPLTARQYAELRELALSDGHELEAD
jgi:hypothetical protein